MKIKSRAIFSTLLLLVFSADVRGCACDPGQPESISSVACGLSRVALQQPALPATFFIQDANPTKPNRWLAIPRANRRTLNEMTAPERAERKAAFLQVAQQRAASRVQPIKEFYAVLSPEQQKIFDSQFHGRHHHHGHH